MGNIKTDKESVKVVRTIQGNLGFRKGIWSRWHTKKENSDELSKVTKDIQRTELRDPPKRY